MCPSEDKDMEDTASGMLQDFGGLNLEEKSDR